MLKNDESPVAIGRRLAVLRVMAGLNRHDLSQQAEVSKTSISYWEHGKGSPMTVRSIGKIIQTFNHLGIRCNEEWLKTGNGEPPINITQSTKTPPQNIDSNVDIQNVRFCQELNIFLTTHQHLDKKIAIMKVENNSMFPAFEKDDVIGGIFLPISSIDFSKEKNCIIKKENILDLRRVRASSNHGLFNLSYFSYDPGCSHPFECHDVKLDLIAPVLRLWR